MKRLALLLVGSMVLFGFSTASSAALIQIQLGGVDLQYNGNNVTDGYPSGANPDPLTNATFIIDGTPMTPADTTGVTLDLDVSGLMNIPDSGNTETVTSSVAGTLELQLGDGEYLKLTLNSSSLTYVPLTSTVQFVFIGSIATVTDLNLPYEIAFDGDIAVSFSTQTVEAVGKGNGHITNFRTQGTGEIQGPGTGVPEPATLGLLTVGALAVLRRRRS